jgi:excisionase family DNA binding protein
MHDYLSTAELARVLRLNPKKVYAMASAGELPAVRVSGKWLFPRELVERWLDEHTVHPASGLMGALLDRMVVLQGSDDPLLARALEEMQGAAGIPVPATSVGSLAGLQAVARGQAHVASCHVEPAEVRRQVGGPAYLVELLEREQGLIFDPARTPKLAGLAQASRRKLRFAARQPASGTARLVERLLREAGVRPAWSAVGPYCSHLEVALAVRQGEADAGVGIEVAARKLGLAFTPLAAERFAVAIPAPFFSHARVARFLEVLVDGLRAAARGVPGYSAPAIGRLQPLGGSP